MFGSMPMEETLGSGDRSGIVVKKRTSSGCLIVRKKEGAPGGAGVSGSRRGFAVKNERTSPRLAVSDSESSEEDLTLPLPSRRGVAARTIHAYNGSAGTIHAYNGLTAPVNHVAEVSDITSWNREEKRKKFRVDSVEFDDYDRTNGEMLRRGFNGGGMGKMFLGSPSFARSGSGMEFERGSSRHADAAGRKNMYFGRVGSLSSDRMRDVERMPLSNVREECFNSDKPIRIQGKNGVLKVHVNKKRLHGSSSVYDQWKSDNNMKDSCYEGMVKKKVVVPPSSAVERGSGKHNSFFRTEKNWPDRKKIVPTVTNDSSEEDLGDSDMLLNQRSEDAVSKNVVVHSLKAEKRRASISVIERDRLTSKISMSSDGDSDNTHASPKGKSQEVEAHESSMRVSLESKRTPKERILAPSKGVKRGSGTEKQKLRENIRNMLLSAGWKIDYKPRRNRDYLDAVYISPSGTSYWSIIKAYDALQKQLDNDAGVNGDRSAFVVSDEILNQLTRKTQKKMEKELKKQSKGTESENMKEASRNKTSNIKDGAESTESYNDGEKPSSYVKQGEKLFKGRNTDSGLMEPLKKSAKVSSSNLQGRKSRKLGRCTLLIRNSDKGLNSESDGFVPYTGKRTILSWLIDSGVVELGQKVNYMNRGKTRVLLEGWITRDGIHCGCCSKILTVSKFEIHAGSKQRQMFQNIYLDSGVSLLECQIDAWNRQEESDRVGFHSVDVNVNDPSDDTCGLCGDGGDLIFCDGCPSTFHQSCFNIRIPSQEDWYCPNCRCRYCGSASEHASLKCSAVIKLLTCDLCERRFHKSCIKDLDGLDIDSVTSDPSFCSQKCRGLFEHLQKKLGLKHELEAGFSWSLIRRADPESDLSLRGHPQRVECFSKLAVALSVMDECFLPIIDRRTGINMMHNVLYNCRSNFSRINYGGFYTVVLERGDEIISAASLRFHGTQLAEMPFIGTRAIYRHQGMCRRLFSAIESALQSLKVEKLVIPDIPELRLMWTAVFGFIPAVESLKLEMRSLNVLVFSGLDMLQKLLLEQEATGSKGIATYFSDAEPMEIEQAKTIAGSPGTSDETNGDLSSEQFHEMGDLVEDMDFDPNSQGGYSNYTHIVNGSSGDARNHNSTELVAKSSESELDRSRDAQSDSEGSSEEVKEKLVSNPLAEVSTKLIENSNVDYCGVKVGSYTEKSKEIVKMNDARRPIKGMPPIICELECTGDVKEAKATCGGGENN